MKKAFLFLALVAFLTTGAIAQEMKAKKHEGVTWHEIVLVDFKAGKVGEAKKFIEKFEAAGAAAKTPGPKKYWLQTGEYDLMLVWKLEEGPASLEWATSPNNVKWRTEFNKQQGSAEAADKVWADYLKLVSRSTSYLSIKNVN